MGAGLADSLGIGGPVSGAGPRRAEHRGDDNGSLHRTSYDRPRRRDDDRARRDEQWRDDRRRGEERPVREKPTGSRIRTEDVDHTWPDIPEWVDTRALGPDVRADLRGLSKQGAEFVAGHLAAAGELADTEPELAWEHARAARSQGGRVAVVRETVGLVAYRAGQWAEAISELRTARRMAGGPGQIAVMADSERALGNPERAIELSKSPEAAQLDSEAAAELAIVVAGARSDLGQPAAALAALHRAAQEVDEAAPYAYRVYYAYAAELAEQGRTSDAIFWFVKAADVDAEDDSDAAERAEALADGRTRSATGAGGGRDGDGADDDRDDVDGADDAGDRADGAHSDADGGNDGDAGNTGDMADVDDGGGDSDGFDNADGGSGGDADFSNTDFSNADFSSAGFSHHDADDGDTGTNADSGLSDDARDDS